MLIGFYENFFDVFVTNCFQFFPTTRSDIQIYFSVFLRISLQLYRVILASYHRLLKLTFSDSLHPVQKPTLN